jgi:ABC-type dipeptide/oligopeptide/nickel transport system permease component
MLYLRLKPLHLILVFFIVTFARFMKLKLLPDDLIDAILMDEEPAPPTEEDHQPLAKELNLDKPAIIRYAI